VKVPPLVRVSRMQTARRLTSTLTSSSPHLRSVPCRNLTTSKGPPATTKGRSSASAIETKESYEAGLEFLAERGRHLGYHLSLQDRKLIAEELADCNGRMTEKEWKELVSKRSMVESEKMTLSDYLAKAHDQHTSQQVLKRLAQLGVSFFSFTGAVAAGEAGMHVVGASVVGTITGLGGGTLNNCLVGATPVGWMKDVRFLVIAGISSLSGFYLYPLVQSGLREGHENQGGVEGGDSQGVSLPRYTLETIALSALAIVGAQTGIVRGLHPLASCSLGVTICFGGVFRDLFCGQELRLGGVSGCQSYALASVSGAAVYVALRELHVWNCSGVSSKLINGGIPIGLRIALGFGTAVLVRACAWDRKPDGLFLTMEETSEQNLRWLKSLLHK